MDNPCYTWKLHLALAKQLGRDRSVAHVLIQLDRAGECEPRTDQQAKLARAAPCGKVAQQVLQPARELPQVLGEQLGGGLGARLQPPSRLAEGGVAVEADGREAGRERVDKPLVGLECVTVLGGEASRLDTS